jgi:hypothetical protein
LRHHPTRHPQINVNQLHAGGWETDRAANRYADLLSS